MHLGQALNLPPYQWTPDVWVTTQRTTDPQPGTVEFGQRAAERRATIARTPIPETSGPGVLYYTERTARRAGEAVLGGLRGGAMIAVVGLVAYALIATRGKP